MNAAHHSRAIRSRGTVGGASGGKLPGRFADLVALYPPRAIHDEADYDNSIEMIERVLRQGDRLTRGQDRYLDTLTTLVQVYEAEHHAIDTSDITPADLLRSLMEAHDLNAGDVADIIGVDRSLVSHVLAGRRALTWDHAKALGERFALTPAAFMD